MKLALKIIAPLLIVAVSWFIFKIQVASAPPPQSKVPPEVVPAADFITSSPSEFAPPVRTFGNVSSYFESTLNAQITGQIIEVSPDFRVGRTVKKDAVLVRLDPTDFDAALVTQEANLTTARRSLAEEEIRAKQAAEDWTISGRDLKSAPPYVLRTPQLAAAHGAVRSAQAAVDKARADLARATLTAPFDALVTARSASLGNIATPQSPLGTLVATARVEVHLPLTPGQVQRLDLPSNLNPALDLTLTSSLYPDAEWTGKITRTSPTISRDQVVTVIAEIENPFAHDPPLAIGSFVNAEINARPLTQTHRVPEAALVNDSFLWAIGPDDRLVRIEADRIHSDLGFAYVTLADSDLTPPLRIVSRPLTNFQSGTHVRPIDPSKK
ncbi:MAG: efflux RND transporter periplasmic adaptor subunit [Verrucomicrobiaceae bacterium]